MFNEVNYLPVEDISSDKLGFNEKANEIADFINNSPSRIPYAISINGPWGSGKSTMLNFIENGLNNSICKVIRFNPWMVTEREEMIKSLFEEIYYEIDGGITKAKETFANYAQKIIPPATKILSFFGASSHGADPGTASMIGNSVGDATKSVGEILFDKPLSKRKKELKNEMELMFAENGKKIVVMIDELDRLFPEEVITVFQMIKSTLDFPGLFFVVAMDEEVVFEALKKKGINRPKYYLQKIFQKDYYINTKFQIMTLTDNFLLNKLDKRKESHVALFKSIRAFFYLDAKEFSPTYEEPFSYYGSQYNNVEWDIHIVPSDDIKGSYHNVFNALRYDMNLQNPRTFINFSGYILEYWDSYYSQVFSQLNKISCFEQSAFLIFVSHYFAPIHTDIVNFHRHTSKDNEDTPIFIKTLRRHLSMLLPEFRQKRGSRVSVPDKVIRESIYHLNKFPDYIRSTLLED